MVADLYQSAGTRARRRDGLGRGLRHRRLGEVAVRRARRRLPLRRAAAARTGCARASPAGRPTRSPFAFEPEPSTTRRARRASCTARRACPRSTRREAGYDIVEAIGVGGHPREVAAPGRAAASSWRASAASRPARRGRPEQRGGMVDPRRAARRGGDARADAPRDPRRLPARRRHPPLAALLHQRRGARAGRRARSATSSTPAPGRPRARGRDGVLSGVARTATAWLAARVWPGSRHRRCDDRP